MSAAHPPLTLGVRTGTQFVLNFATSFLFTTFFQSSVYDKRRSNEPNVEFVKFVDGKPVDRPATTASQKVVGKGSTEQLATFAGFFGAAAGGASSGLHYGLDYYNQTNDPNSTYAARITGALVDFFMCWFLFVTIHSAFRAVSLPERLLCAFVFALNATTLDAFIAQWY